MCDRVEARVEGLFFSGFRFEAGFLDGYRNVRVFRVFESRVFIF